jgi:hypothetical protein
MNKIDLQINTLPHVDARRQREIIELACRISTATPEYILARFECYDHLALGYSTGKLHSAQFIQRIEDEEQLTVYFGPAFSRHSYVEFFIEYLDSLIVQAGDRKLYITAELQNPGLFATFKALFPSCSYPRIEADAIPQDVIDRARQCCSRLDHIKGFNETTFSTHSIKSIYTPNARYAGVEAWCMQRGIDLRAGDNIFYTIALPACEAARSELIEVAKGRLASQKHDRRAFLAMALAPFLQSEICHA